MFDNIGKYFSLSLVIIISMWVIITDKEKLKKFTDRFSNTKWLSQASVMLLFTIVSFIFNKPGSRELDSTKKAVVAFIIALFASLDLTIAPFWIVWVLSYSFDAWV